MKDKKICVIGLGYIGLPTAALLANKGFSVCGVDINKEIVSTINQGEVHIVEVGLAAFVKSAILNGKMKAYNTIQQSDIYLICVPTPFINSKEIPQPDLKHVFSAIKNMAQFIKPGDFIILESTSPVGTTKKIEKMLSDYGINTQEIHIAYCPERVLPGKTMIELVENDRIIGGLNQQSTSKIMEFYRFFINGQILETDSDTAEMCKLAENSFRDVNIAFANELSIICEKKGIDVWNLIQLANRHPRVNILQPSVGVGGHCISVDPWFLISEDVENTNLMHTARKINNFKTTWVINKITNMAKKYSSRSGFNPKIICLGIAFKPNIDDLRESKALEVVEALIEDGYDVGVVEPNVNSFKNISFINLSEAFEKAEIICVLVKHREFMQQKIKDKLKKHHAIDFCGVLN